jgi:3-hydroxyisobutyrate dehydrogenase
MTDKRERIGFIGVGLMGTAMVLRLLDRGWTVTVWNLEPERLPPVIEAGATAAASPAAVAAVSDIVLMCVLHTAAVERCVFAPDGLAAGGRPGMVLVDHSTIEPAATRTMAARLRRETGMGWVDAPVSGGPPATREGGLTVMAGGEEGDVATIVPVMRDLSANFTHMGPSGSGQTVKTINQAIVGTGYVLMAEALALAEASGVEAAKLPACLAGGHADSNLLQKLYPRMAARDFDPPTAFARQLLKDMVAVAGFAETLGLDLPVVSAATEQYARFAGLGNDMAESAAIIQLYDGTRR